MLLWHRLVATAPIRPLAWGPPYAMGVALEKTKRQKKWQFKVGGKEEDKTKVELKLDTNNM